MNAVIFVKPDFAKYTAASQEIFSIIGKYGTIAPASLDEAYLDIVRLSCRICGLARVDPPGRPTTAKKMG